MEEEKDGKKRKRISHKSFADYTPDYQTLLRAGPRAEPLRQAHARFVVGGSHRSRALITKLLTLACAAGSIGYARRLLVSVPSPDAFLFDSLVKASSSSGFPAHAFLFYRLMLRRGISPTSYTFTSAVKSCAAVSSLSLGRLVHAHAEVLGLGSDRFVLAGLVTFYAKSGDLRVARKVFDEMPERTVVAWNAMISAYEQHGRVREAVEAFHRMRESGFEPDSATFVTVLSACSQLGGLGLGRWIHGYVVDNGLETNVILGTALINMYGKCGDLAKAREVFDSMADHNVFSWTAIISAYATHGRGPEALDLFRAMRSRGPRPNGVTLVAVLSACAHSGLVDEARSQYSNMGRDHGVVPGLEHQVCLVDALGRAGKLDEAREFVDKLASPVPAAAWTALLGACRMHKRFDLGAEVAERLIALEPENPGHYVALSNIYALEGRTDGVEAIRGKMVRRRLKKETGYSAVEVKQRPHLFKNGDKSRPEIYSYLDELTRRCKEAGYVPVSTPVLHEVEEEERELALRYHSERLAIAFALMKSKSGSEQVGVVRVVKNLRICEDCHLAVKYISVVANTEILVRDRLRFHHFKDGRCSCLDYW